MPMPGDTPIPVSRFSLSIADRGLSSVLIELAFDQAGERIHRRRRIVAAGGDLDHAARGGREHHQPHDGAAGHRIAVLADPDLGRELGGGLDEAGGGAGVQPLLVADLDAAPNRRGSVGGVRREMAGLAVVAFAVGAHRRASANSCEATLMYLRPASCAPRTVRSRLSLWRRLASLISIGRLTPAITSTLPRSITEIARFDGVPPNMSVSNTAPSPVSTSPIERRMSWRRCSMSSSGPMQTAAIWVCAPTTCSSAATNSAASRP